MDAPGRPHGLRSESDVAPRQASPRLWRPVDGEHLCASASLGAGYPGKWKGGYDMRWRLKGL
jgi:hypothetical protein